MRECFQVRQSIQKDPAMQMIHFMLNHASEKPFGFPLHGLALTIEATDLNPRPTRHEPA